MIFTDALVASALAYLSYTLWRFLCMAQGNVGKHESGSDEAFHFVDHLIAGTLGFIGCTVGAMVSIVHLVLQNTGSHAVPEYVELLGNVAYSLLFIAATLFVHHMIKEETPGHPFFYQHLHHD